MNSIKIVLIIVSLVSLSACCSKKDKSAVVSEEVVKIVNQSESKMLEAGFQKASIVHFAQEKSPCEYLIEIESSKLLLEPQKELDSEYKVAKSPIWIKYQPQRRMSRCANAQPVAVIAMEKRN